jgi:pyridoxine kinase
MKRVLSVQSHVVSGYVGNKCATFPLQLFGYEVDPVMSVHFSNHTGYPSFKGTIMDGAQLSEVVSGLEANGLLQHSHLLTGYIGSTSFLVQVLHVLQKLKAQNPDLVYGDRPSIPLASTAEGCMHAWLVEAPAREQI